MNNVAEIEIGIDHKGRADMFGTDPETESDSHPEKKHFGCDHGSRVRAEISSAFQVLRRLSGKAPKRTRLFLREP